jgi:hypothetical protein
VSRQTSYSKYGECRQYRTICFSTVYNLWQPLPSDALTPLALLPLIVFLISIVNKKITLMTRRPINPSPFIPASDHICVVLFLRVYGSSLSLSRTLARAKIKSVFRFQLFIIQKNTKSSSHTPVSSPQLVSLSLNRPHLTIYSDRTDECYTINSNKRSF